MKQVWSLDRGPFGHGMAMCEDGLYINLELGGAFKIRGEGLRVKVVKQRVEICQEAMKEANVKNVTTGDVSGNSSAQTDKGSSGSVESASKNLGTRGK